MQTLMSRSTLNDTRNIAQAAAGVTSRWLAGKQFFPDANFDTIEYSIEATYHGIYQDLRTARGSPAGDDSGCSSRQGSETFALYAVGRYSSCVKKLNEPRYARLRSATAALHGLVRVLLFKRFESSVEAFRETVRRIIRSHRLAQQFLVRGVLPTEADMDTRVSPQSEMIGRFGGRSYEHPRQGRLRSR